jgi:uncharacterized protein YecT (DUF1311 family)
MFLLLPTLSLALLVSKETKAQNPCEEPPSQRQVNDCADYQYNQADARLNKVYQKVMQYMTDDLERAQKAGNTRQHDYEQTAASSLKEAERAWLSYRDIQCKAAGHQYEGGSMSPMIYSQCLTTLTHHRIADLKSIDEDGDQKLE